MPRPDLTSEGRVLEAPRSTAGVGGEDMLKLFTTLGLPLDTQPFSLKIKKGKYTNKSIKRHFRLLLHGKVTDCFDWSTVPDLSCRV